jgi:glycerophosphoryl diester phosphodiesterase
VLRTCALFLIALTILLISLILLFVGERVYDFPTFDLQGHRGARGLAPENTLAAFAKALSIGVTTLELDLVLTRDGVLVVSHDPRLMPHIARGPDGGWLEEPGPAIRQLPVAALGTFDVGRIDPASRYAERFPDQQPVDGARIPRFDEVVALARAAGNGSVRFNVETKLTPLEPDLAAAPEVFANAVVDAVRRLGIAGRTTVQSFDWRTLRRVREIAPEIATVCLTAERDWLNNVEVGQDGPSPWLAGLDVDDHGGSLPRLVDAAGCAVWSPHWRDLDAAELAEARRLGLAVVVWTVNRPAEMQRLIDLGVDGLITDYPDRLRAVMARKGLPLPPATPVAP